MCCYNYLRCNPTAVVVLWDMMLQRFFLDAERTVTMKTRRQMDQAWTLSSMLCLKYKPGFVDISSMLERYVLSTLCRVHHRRQRSSLA
jgi:hypothetical protein